MEDLISDVPPLWPEGYLEQGSFAPADRPRIVPFLVPPDTSGGNRGAVIVCPGGGYRTRAAHEGEPVARWLSSLGVSAFVLHYRVKPITHPHPLADAQRAIRYVRSHAPEWGIDPHRIGILGFSAGGHLAASAGTHFDEGDPNAVDPVERVSSRPDALVLCYAVISFGSEYGHRGSMVNLLGEDPPPDLRTSLSNELHVTAGTPPTFLWHTAEDAGVPVENSLLFAGALSRHKVPLELHVYPKGRHGLGLAPDDPHVGSWPQLCGTWLRSLGFSGGQE